MSITGDNYEEWLNEVRKDIKREIRTSDSKKYKKGLKFALKRLKD